MKKQTQSLNTLALSVELALPTSFQAVMSIPSQVADQVLLPNLVPMLEKVLPAVVSIRVEGTASRGRKILERFKKFFDDDLPDQSVQPSEGLGSGVIINASKGYVLTNDHVISQTQKISIRLSDRREFDAELIGSDDQNDIVLLQIQNPNKLTQIAIADSNKLRVDDFAAAVGSPFGLGQAAISGVVPVSGRNGLNLEDLENFIQTDASISRDNSGDVLLNLNSKLTGTNTIILASGGGSIGIGFAIPNNIARTLAQQLIDFGEIKCGLLGIKDTETSTDIIKAFDLDVQRDVLVNEALPGFGSVKTGVGAGDIITSLNGKPLDSFAELRSRIATTEPGTKVKPGLLRNGRSLEVEVTLDTSTSSSASAEMIISMLEGATLDDGQLEDGGRSIRIDEVVKGGSAAQTGLQKDDVIIGVNRDRINSVAEMRKVLAIKLAITALQVVRGSESIYLLMR